MMASPKPLIKEDSSERFYRNTVDRILWPLDSPLLAFLMEDRPYAKYTKVVELILKYHSTVLSLWKSKLM